MKRYFKRKSISKLKVNSLILMAKLRGTIILDVMGDVIKNER